MGRTAAPLWPRTNKIVPTHIESIFVPTRPSGLILQTQTQPTCPCEGKATPSYFIPIRVCAAPNSPTASLKTSPEKRSPRIQQPHRLHPPRESDVTPYKPLRELKRAVWVHG